MIILTVEQAEEVMAMEFPQGKLRAFPLLTGAWALPEAVLTDPTYEAAHAFLAPLERRELSRAEFEVPMDTEEGGE